MSLKPIKTIVTCDKCGDYWLEYRNTLDDIEVTCNNCEVKMSVFNQSESIEEYFIETHNGDIELYKKDGDFFDHDTQDLFVATFYDIEEAEKICNLLNAK